MKKNCFILFASINNTFPALTITNAAKSSLLTNLLYFLLSPQGIMAEWGMVSMSTERVGVRKKPEVNNGQATTGAAAPVEETPNHIVYKKVSLEVKEGESEGDWTESECDWTESERDWTDSEDDWVKVTVIEVSECDCTESEYDWIESECDWTESENNWTESENNWNESKSHWTESKSDWTENEGDKTYAKGHKEEKNLIRTEYQLRNATRRER